MAMRSRTSPMMPMMIEMGIRMSRPKTWPGSAAPCVSQQRVTSMSGLSGFHRIRVAARPSPSAVGKITGVVYIRKGIAMVTIRPTSV